jgi:hypothetical protein
MSLWPPIATLIRGYSFPESSSESSVNTSLTSAFFFADVDATLLFFYGPLRTSSTSAGGLAGRNWQFSCLWSRLPQRKQAPASQRWLRTSFDTHFARGASMPAWRVLAAAVVVVRVGSQSIDSAGAGLVRNGCVPGRALNLRASFHACRSSATFRIPAQ